ncbi:MAG: VOC family protein [Candidatus Nanopelagicales bacterium]|nr:VOC family protein [Candidatus Nanopelagicales bacterium]
MPKIYIDHVSFLVNDLDKARADWAQMLRVLSPGHLEQVTEGEGADVQEGVRMKWCTFQNPDPMGVSIQLWTAASPGTWVDKVLAKRGEHVHHVCFLSDDFDQMCADLRANDVPLLLDEPSNPDTMPWLKWNFVPADKTHGTLLELATRYLPCGNRWIAHPDNVENVDFAKELLGRFAHDAND